ncbi:hypothetical protein BGZ97_002626 [Linnemannia gamsii]|uniref:Uncharacterized protein n=1 Tax=Linnemannia gamsii TaxID=64522 RepID=A0A9P6QUH9_9FUNG|nr:hypothetical protein BGZ97_002626 [Linnemannia gamsii]
MNPNAASFTPSFVKPSSSDCAASDYSNDNNTSSNRPSRRSTVDSSREGLISGLGISSPTTEVGGPRGQGLTVNTKAMSPSSFMRQDRSTFATTASELSPMPLSALPADFNPDEFRINLVRQITDKLETGLDRHFSQLVSATTSAALPLSPATSDHDGSGTATAGGTGADSTTTINNLKKLLRTTTAELERVKGKNQELRESNHKLELQHMEATHQRAPHQHHNRSSSTASNGALQSQNIQRLMREIATLKSERDALKIRSWELEKKPYAQQHQQRPAHFVDLENERNRLVEELGAKTVAMEDLWNKNEGLMVRAKEYEKRVWELEGQCAALEEECAALPTLRSDLVEMEARAVAADALVEKTHDIEGQLALVKSLQDRMQELETTNAELDHSNWDLSERLNIAINQHTLLTKEFESFRSMDEGGRRLEFLANRNRELETLLAEQAKISPDYKDEYERVAVELEKVKVRMPQLEGQAKQVALLRSKTLQLEKQIKTMEELEPRLEEIQNLHERNLFLESELGELEHLRAREMELENELEESKARLMQLETNKARMASFSGLKSASPGSRVRSGSVATAQPNPTLFHEGDENASELNVRSGSPIQQQPSHFQKPLSRRTSQSIGSADYGYGVPMSPTTKGASAWPSGRSSMSMSVNRTSTSSNSSSSGLVLTRSGSPRQTSEDDKVILPAAPAAASMTTEEPESHLVDSSAVAADAMSTTPTLVTQEVN